MAKKFDFSGYATKNDLRCADGRIIRHNAFKDDDGRTVPLVWQHMHDDPMNVLGHALLENRDDGVYMYGKFNEDTEMGRHAKQLVEHGDITAVSIHANHLVQRGGDVLHGVIREVSLVLAGANPGALIDYPILSHGEEAEDEAIIYTGEELMLEHSLEAEKEVKEGEEKVRNEESLERADGGEETVEEVFNTLTDKQKNAVYAIVGAVIQDEDDGYDEEEEDDEPMKHNVFDAYIEDEENTISHADMEAVIADAKRFGSMRESAIQHGIDNIDYLFPDAQTINNTPDFIKRDTGWADSFMSSVHHTPFSRVKSIHANITADEARARGYIKGNMKKEEFFGLIKRQTLPCTVYKKQKLDRDDKIDIVDFDVVAWMKGEMRIMLNEEIARAALIGDGRVSGSDDKIPEDNIRPIWTDNSVYTINATIEVANTATDADKAAAFIDEAVRARKDYKGSGNPVLYTTEDMLTEMLLLKDTNKHRLYATETELATAMRVSKIVTVPVMESKTRTVNGVTRTLAGIIVNPSDYNIGADKGGAVSLFEDFDIDYNADKYLIETRCSGALTTPYSAIAVEFVPAS